MNKLPTIKVYDIDYDFIIKNYLDPTMWQKIWTLFAYKTFVVTLKIDTISCQNEKISFRIEVKDNSDRDYGYEWGGRCTDKCSSDTVYYSLKIDDISFLKAAINSEIIKIIEELESYAIIALDGYNDIKSLYEDEERLLTQIANDFLDDEGVMNDDIRDAYIDTYVSNNTKLDGQLSRFVNNLKYSIFADFYLIFANATGDKKIINRVNEYTSKIPNIDIIKKEIEEYEEYMESDEFQEEMQDCLEGV